MFSYLRPHHKRGNPSSPTSPLPPQHSSDLPLLSSDSLHQVQPRLHHSESLRPESPVSPVAPVLPPIPRVASRYEQKTAVGKGQEAYEGPQRDVQRASSTALGSDDEGDVQRNPTITVQEHQEFPNTFGTVGAAAAQQTDGLSKATLGPSMRMECSTVGSPPLRPFTSTSNLSSKEQALTTLPPQRPAPPAPPRSPNLVQPPSSHFRSGKAKLNLLNPMSLLMRRRSAQGLPSIPASLASDKTLTLPAMPDDYDPRIRGTAVHDFSAPRKKRNYSSNDIGAVSPGIGSSITSVPQSADGGVQQPDLKASDVNFGRFPSPRGGEWDHSPVFKEQFGDDVEPWREGQTSEPSVPKGAFDFRTGACSTSTPEPDRNPPPLPPFAKHLPSDIGISIKTRTEVENANKGMMLAVVPEAGSPDALSHHISTRSSSPDSPPKTRSRALSGADLSPQPPGPKRLTSNASRFSFDMAGIGSTNQERLLEEKHKEHAAARKSSQFEGEGSELSEIDDSDEDEMNAFDEHNNGPYEEPIPGVNADPDDRMHLEGGAIEAFDFTPSRMSVVISPVTTSTVTSPRDSKGQLIGFALSKGSPQQNSSSSNIADLAVSQREIRGHLCGADELGFVGSDNVLEVLDEQTSIGRRSDPATSALDNLRAEESEDDDMYFDDGIIEHVGHDDGQSFDESMFDLDKEEYHRSVMELQPPRPLKFSTTDSSPARYTSEEDENDSIMPQVSQSTDTNYPPLMNPAGNTMGYQAIVGQQQQNDESSFGEPSGLTQDNLAAYHNALVHAANQAAANGEFSRRDSLSDMGQDGYARYNEESHGGLLPDDGHHEKCEDTFSPTGFGGDAEDDYEYDSALEDDPMIAAANAEALANDADGFYGQEFGFYAQANGANEAQYVNGGYFGPRGSEGMFRSKSGRIILQEPNLTPITERSEYSTRNSYISLSIPGTQVNQTLPSPALAQLMSPDFTDDEDLSLSALMKLRRGAWGGSNGSLKSAGSGGSGSSVLAYLPPFGVGGLALASTSQFTSSNFSLASSGGVASSNGQNGSDESSLPASPTVTLANLAAVGNSNAADVTDGVRAGESDNRNNVVQVKGKTGHSRVGSGADSVSYMKEEDTWVLERRRMSITGEVEVVGREVVAGGRI